MATLPSITAWRIPCTEELGGLQSMGSQRVRHDRETSSTQRDMSNKGKETVWKFFFNESLVF